MTHHLDVSVGPVQTFVAQSRRTRDLWGSSYLLSVLSAHAMRGATKEAGARIVRPNVVGDPLFEWVLGRKKDEPPLLGSIPNHFVVTVDEGQVTKVADDARSGLETAWQRIAGAVWDQFIAPHVEGGQGTREIWDRQLAGFWEVSWTAGTHETGGPFARRKHWRTHRLPDEPGDKCSVMHDLQELSGFVRASGEAQRQDEFWAAVRKGLGALDLRPDERLSAIALIKRLFPKVADKALGWNVDATRWPSTLYLAAIPWLRQTLAENPEAVRRYGELVREAGGELSENPVMFSHDQKNKAPAFLRLSANYFHVGSVEDEKRCPFGDEDRRADVAEALRSLHRESGRAPTFYALLLADGDHLGKLAGKLGGDEVGTGLSVFTAEVPNVVKSHDGVTVYAGGDDVLAMLPVQGAIDCAWALAREYRAAFGEDVTEATLSAGLALAHIRLPLSGVLEQAHRLLDGVAKDENGRDSLAVGILKPGGLQSQWVSTWERNGTAASDRLNELVARLSNGEASEPGISSSLIYRIRETMSLLCDWPSWQPGAWGRMSEGMELRGFLRAELVRSLDHSGHDGGWEHASEFAELIEGLLYRAPRGGFKRDTVGVDALLLARFLASGGREDQP